MILTIPVVVPMIKSKLEGASYKRIPNVKTKNNRNEKYNKKQAFGARSVVYWITRTFW